MRTRQLANCLKAVEREYILSPSRLTAGNVVACRPGNWGNLLFPSIEAAEDYCRTDAGGRAHRINREGGL